MSTLNKLCYHYYYYYRCCCYYKRKRIESNTKLRDSSGDFTTLNFPEESINTYNTGYESEGGSDFSTDVGDSALLEIVSIEVFLQRCSN